jgi:hypothetical protein
MNLRQQQQQQQHAASGGALQYLTNIHNRAKLAAGNIKPAGIVCAAQCC